MVTNKYFYKNIECDNRDSEHKIKGYFERIKKINIYF